MTGLNDILRGANDSFTLVNRWSRSIYRKALSATG